MSLELELVRAYRRYLEHLAGKHNQKSHGNKYGSADAIRANVKRLGGDKAALKSMAKRARKDTDFQKQVKQSSNYKKQKRQRAAKLTKTYQQTADFWDNVAKKYGDTADGDIAKWSKLVRSGKADWFRNGGLIFVIAEKNARTKNGGFSQEQYDKIKKDIFEIAKTNNVDLGQFQS